MRTKKRRKTKKKNKLYIVCFFLLLIIALGVFIYLKINKTSKPPTPTFDITQYYSEFVKAKQDSPIYQHQDGKYLEVGQIAKDTELSLLEYTEDNYFKFKLADEEYYISYKDTSIIDNLSQISERYKVYIPFNKNIITKETTHFYDEDSNLIYTINKSFNFPIIIMDNDKYGIEYNNRLLYIPSSDVSSTEEHQNTSLKNSNGVAVLNYHFFYDSDDKEMAAKCNEALCVSTKQLSRELDYMAEHNYITVKAQELEMYLDKKIQLPKSVYITIDDGATNEAGLKLLAERKQYATVFLITGWFDPANYFQSEYIELHSHGEDLHNRGVCPGGQGGAIKCLDEQKLIDDLTTSSKKLNGSTVFAYPFYEYNSYSIKVLKKAGYTMAFKGESGDCLVHIGDNKYTLNRFVMFSYTTDRDFANYLGQIRN